jgi:cytochrome c
MDSMEVNKGIAAVLVAGIAFMGATLLSDALVHPVLLEKPAIAIKGAAGESDQAPKADPPVEALLQTADPKKGEAITQRLCVSCHTFNEGGRAGVGPNLYGVVGGPHGHMQGFDYSNALKSKQGPWTFDELYQWIKSPSTYAPGTKMTFAGLANPEQRAEVIAYLNSNSAHPLPLPPPPAAAPAAATAPAGAKPGATPGAGTPAPGAKGPTPASAPANAPSAAAKAAPQGQGTMTQPAANQNQVQEQQSQGQQPPQATTITPGPGSAHAKPDESQKP